MEDLIKIVVNYGLSIVISAIFIFLVLSAFKSFSKYFERLIIAVERSSDALKNNTTIIKDAKKIHESMDKKLDEIKQDVKILKDDRNRLKENEKQYILILNRLEKKIDDLAS